MGLIAFSHPCPHIVIPLQAPSFLDRVRTSFGSANPSTEGKQAAGISSLKPCTYQRVRFHHTLEVNLGGESGVQGPRRYDWFVIFLFSFLVLLMQGEVSCPPTSSGIENKQKMILQVLYTWI